MLLDFRFHYKIENMLFLLNVLGYGDWYDVGFSSEVPVDFILFVDLVCR